MDFENSKAVYIKSYIMSWKCIYSLTTNKHNRQFHWWQSHGMFWLQIFYLCVTFLIKTGHFLVKLPKYFLLHLIKRESIAQILVLAGKYPPFFVHLIFRS